MTFHEQITNDALALYDKDNLPRKKLEFIQRKLLATDTKYDSLLTRYQEQEGQLGLEQKMPLTGVILAKVKHPVGEKVQNRHGEPNGQADFQHQPYTSLFRRGAVP